MAFRGERECGEKSGEADENVGGSDNDMQAVEARSDEEGTSVDSICYCKRGAAILMGLASRE